MIDHYEFIDANGDGEKERVLGPTVQLYNKLSAEETNNIRAKLNELADAVNISPVPLYEVFSLKYKGDGNLDLATIEVGDIAHRYSTVDGIWENALFNGGDPQNPADYTKILDSFPKKQFEYLGGDQDFDLETNFGAIAVFWNGALLDDSDWVQINNILTINFPISVGDKIKPI